MIEKNYGLFLLMCDNCGFTIDDEFIDFYDAVDYKKEAGWRSIKEQDIWLDLCPDCIQDMVPKKI